MDTAVYLPLVVSSFLWLIGARLGRWLPPPTAVRLLTATALVTALSTGFVLAALAFEVLARVPIVAAFGHWSAATLASGDPVPTVAGTAAGFTVTVLLTAAIRRIVLAGRALADAATTCRRLGPDVGGLVVVHDDRPDAYTLPLGLSGRVVVSTAMLRALNADERQVLLAHESAHVRHRHHIYVQLAELAAAANPLLRPLAVAVRSATERWADEVAAHEVGDRRLAARALARAGLARIRTAPKGFGRPSPSDGISLAAADCGVSGRALALLDNPPRQRRVLAIAVTGLMAIAFAASAETADDVENQVEQAQAAYQTAGAHPVTTYAVVSPDHQS